MIVVDHEPWHFDVFEPCKKQAGLFADKADIYKKIIPPKMGVSAIEDGKVLAMAGVIVDEAKTTGEFWLFVGDEILNRPVALYRNAKNILTALVKVWDLKSYTAIVRAKDAAARNFVEHLGFVPKNSKHGLILYERLV